MRAVSRAAMIASAVMAALSAGCDVPAGQDAPEHPPGYVVDSILPPAEALRRFRAGLDSPATLDGPRSRDSLVRRFLSGVAARNRAALDSLAMTRAEFAYLVFPQVRWSKPPYSQPPDVAWMLFRANSRTGLTRLLERADRLRLQSYTCPDSAERDGTLRLWTGCTVRVIDGGRSRELHLFGTIIELAGRYKFAGFNNDF